METADRTSVPSPMRRATSGRLGLALAGALLLGAHGCGRDTVAQTRALPSSEVVDQHCRELIGAPRVEEVTEGVFVAQGYDLANTTLIQTPEGNVIVDPGMTRARAAQARDALLARAPGPTRALIFTHSHIDHVGGAAVWVEERERAGDPPVEIWATANFEQHLLKQYGLFAPTEQRRGARQMGRDVADADVPCSALGRRVDIEGALNSGLRMPNKVFEGQHTLALGELTLELVEAHGETHDQLYVWIPERALLLAGDNYYHSFPNLYTIRGTRPRPVDDWIRSLDAMRRRAPEHLVPSHTPPLHGRAHIQDVLTSYRDAIQWVRDEVVRGSNRGESVEQLVARVGLPPHLADKPYLQELYGQVDWSVRAIFSNELGWFDGGAEHLYPLADDARARREIALMGGPQVVLDAAIAARGAAQGPTRDDARWSVHLLARLRAAHDPTWPFDQNTIERELASSLAAVAEGVHNTNGRAYLLQAAHELRHGARAPENPELEDAVLAGIPVDRFLEIMTVRLYPEQAIEVHEALAFEFTDVARRFTVTVRRGVAELSEGEPLPGTPAPVATIRVDSLTWKRLATKRESAAAALAAGRMVIDGSKAGFLGFMRRFDRA
ncbi:MAG: MBL fold metallo-hydrolase [Myxococcales bacterium]|nr:MBL fold metallo-hydrolase [Myxococcales bacterium]